jgi:hypothetical protein
MEVFYGERQTFRFLNGNGRPVVYKTITLTMGGDGSTQTRQTNAEGKASFDLLSARHFKFGNSLENGGVPGMPGRIDYRDYTFSAEGYHPYVLSR